MKKLGKLDIVLSVFNQEKVIKRVLYGLFFHTTTPFNLILVFDGCTDRSEINALNFIRMFKPKKLKNVIIKHSENVYETKANNIGFKEVTQPFVITLQDDMVIQEMGWERRLTYPLRYFNDVIGVSSRHAQNIKIMNSKKEIYCDRRARELGNLKRNVFSIRDVINRGPIAFRTDYLKKLNYFDESFAPCNLDEADLSLRAWLKYGWKVGAFWINYESQTEWGKTRSKDTTMPVISSNKKNRIIIEKKYKKYLRSGKKHTQDIIINDKDIDYLPYPDLPQFKKIISYFMCHSWDETIEYLRKRYKLRTRLRNNISRIRVKHFFI